MSNPYKITLTDKLLAVTFLKLLPRKVTPNQITVFRFFTIPFIAALFLLNEYLWGTLLFAVSAFTDALDGALARTKHEISEWGSTFDPLADKLLIGITAFLILPRYFGVWLVFAIVFIEMILIGMAYYNSHHGREHKITANWWGKSKMLCQSFGVLFVLLYIIWPVALLLILAQWILYLAIVLAAISIITYSV